jgi:hypothetical protein
MRMPGDPVLMIGEAQQRHDEAIAAMRKQGSTSRSTRTSFDRKVAAGEFGRLTVPAAGLGYPASAHLTTASASGSWLLAIPISVPLDRRRAGQNS